MGVWETVRRQLKVEFITMMVKGVGRMGDRGQEDGLGLKEGGQPGPSFQPSGFYNAKTWPFRQRSSEKNDGGKV